MTGLPRKGLLDDGQGAAADARTIDDDDRVFEIQGGSLCQHSIEQHQHCCVGIRASAEQDDAGTVGLVERNEARVVEVGSDDDSLLAPGYFEHVAVR